MSHKELADARSADGSLRLNFGYPDQEAYEENLQDLIRDSVASRIAARDATLWGPDAESEASIRLAWVDLAESSRPLINEIIALREELLAEGLDHIVLAGMGGSSLAPEVICGTDGVPLVTLDTTDPGQVAAAIADDLDRTVLVVSSKSGGTVETDSHRRAYQAAFEAAGIDPASRIIVVTDPGSPFQTLGEEAGYRKVFLADAQVGGRYSALTAFGLVPSGLAGADIERLLDDAAAVAPSLTDDSKDNPALRLGTLLGMAHWRETEKLVFADNDSGLVGFADWAEQLIAESTGKDGHGLLPVVTEGLGAPGFDDARADAVVVYLGEPDAGPHPTSGFGVSVAGPLGAQMLLWEYAIVIASRMIGINPFDQPNVEEAKIQARQLLDNPEASAAGEPLFVDNAIEVYGSDELLGSAASVSEALGTFFRAAPDYGYIAIQAYLDRHGDAAAAELRADIARRTGLQTTFGWGPRFLHSTGQYHKGGHPNGVFLQITAEHDQDLAVPDRPYTFGVLQLAQALGDAEALRKAGHPVLRLHLQDRDAGLAQIRSAVSHLKGSRD
ncbi:glucose-6-phosphate isomerase [Saxibacter everestensis]|uniref:Glucose-6-phosphate isomerase n=1 Tax=Saxibacter everestensis TaxID=2909229 RepID=A0ABY8QY61_9MICO|nr:glucose-6-phosphate isomerase [Brevibacteriaceae bacterium ZFBP1038]